MFDNTTIQDAFIGMVGLRQSNNPNLAPLNSSILYDGVNLQAKHPLLSHENIDMTFKDFSLYDFPDYGSGTTYAIGDRVDYNGTIYESSVGSNTGNTPNVSPTEWEVVNLLSLWLEDIMRESITGVVNEVFNRKRVSRQTKTTLENIRLSYHSGSTSYRVVNTGSLVGFKISVFNNTNLAAILERIGFQFTGPVTFPLYIYHSSQLEPIETITITHTQSISFQWQDLKRRLVGYSEEYDHGHYYIMYDQEDLGAVQAIYKSKNYNNRPCSTCDNDSRLYDQYSQFLRIWPVEVKSGKRNGINLWDIQDTLMMDHNFGINMEFTAKCDLTNTLVRQKEVFKYAVRDMFMFNLLNEMANGTRQNHLQNKLDQKARAELVDKKAGGMGFNEQLEKQLQSVDFEMSALDSVCMPCNVKEGLRYSPTGLSR